MEAFEKQAKDQRDRQHQEFVDEQRSAQRERLGLGPPPMFRHRRR